MAVRPSSQQAWAPSIVKIDHCSTHYQHPDGHMDQLQFNQAARAFGHAWRASLQQPPNSDSRPHIGLSILQSSWNVQACKDPFTQQEVVYLAMTRLLHTAPPAAAQHQHADVQLQPHEEQQWDSSTGTSRTSAGQQEAPEHHHVDAASLDDQAPPPGSSSALHMYDLHIVWHPAYRVPTLLLKGYCTDGRPLSWTSVESDFPHWEGLRRGMGHGSWAFITPLDQGHPILHRATAGHHWFMLHPCNTHDIMQLLVSSPAATEQTIFSTEEACVASGDITPTECDQSEEESDGVRNDHLETGDGGKRKAHDHVSEDEVGMLLRRTVLTDKSNQMTVDGRYLAAWLVAIVGPVFQLHVVPQMMKSLMRQLHMCGSSAGA